MRIRTWLFTLMRIRILLRIKVMPNLRPLVYRPSRAPFMSVRGLPWLHFAPLNLLNFDFNASSDPASDPCGTGSVSMPSGSAADEKLLWSKMAIYCCPSYRRWFQPSKKNIQHIKKWNLFTFFYVCGSIFFSWIQIQGPHWIRIHSTGK